MFEKTLKIILRMFGFLLVFLALILIYCNDLKCDVPRKTGGIYEITFDGLDSAGDPTPGYRETTTFVLGSVSDAQGTKRITGLSGGIYYTLEAGYLGQDLIQPGDPSSFAAQSGPTARQVRLTWTCPGDDTYVDPLLSGSLFYIARTTITSEAENYGFWISTKSHSLIKISTSGISAGDTLKYDVTGLTQGSTYYFRIWTMDQACNWSEISSGATAYSEYVVLAIDILDHTTTFSFGDFFVNKTTVSETGIIIRNMGTVNQTYKVHLVTGTASPANTAWNEGLTPGANRFVLYGIFNSTRPEIGDYSDAEGNDIITRVDQTASDDNFSMDGDLESMGVNRAPYVTEGIYADTTFYYKIKTPLASSTSSYQVIPIVITAEEAE